MQHRGSAKPESIISTISRIRDRANRFIVRELEKCGIADIVPAHGQILFPLMNRGGPMKLGELAGLCGRSKSTVTSLTTTLELNGYVTRRPCPKDGRCVLVDLTGKARVIEDCLTEISGSLVDCVYRGIPEEERMRVMCLLLQVESNLSENITMRSGVENPGIERSAE